MTNWPAPRKGPPAVPASEEELIAGSIAWHGVCPPRCGRGDPEWDEWRSRFDAWCKDRGTDPLALLRLRRDTKLSALTLARLEGEFDG